jgi:hypothetical protein
MDGTRRTVKACHGLNGFGVGNHDQKIQRLSNENPPGEPIFCWGDLIVSMIQRLKTTSLKDLLKREFLLLC